MSKDKRKNYFGYNRHRKHYSYVYDGDDKFRKNLLISTKPVVRVKRKGKTKIFNNVPLEKHPNPKSTKQVYLINRKYVDKKSNISVRKGWKFSKKDKIKVCEILNKNEKSRR